AMPPTTTVIIMTSILNPHMAYFSAGKVPHCLTTLDSDLRSSHCCIEGNMWAAAYGGTAVLTCEPV
ncbi:MAG: hypothetical protein ACYS1A_18120, partial [Planctomycetota bacterium]